MPNGQMTPITSLLACGDVLNNTGVFFESNPDAVAMRHHAGVAAEALRWAFESAMRRLVT